MATSSDFKDFSNHFEVSDVTKARSSIAVQITEWPTNITADYNSAEVTNLTN